MLAHINMTRNAFQMLRRILLMSAITSTYGRPTPGGTWAKSNGWALASHHPGKSLISLGAVWVGQLSLGAALNCNGCNIATALVGTQKRRRKSARLCHRLNSYGSCVCGSPFVNAITCPVQFLQRLRRLPRSTSSKAISLKFRLLSIHLTSEAFETCRKMSQTGIFGQLGLRSPLLTRGFCAGINIA